MTMKFGAFLGVLSLLVATGALGFDTSVHKEITKEALPFLKEEVLEDINDEHWYIDAFFFGSSEKHFDNCRFRESVEWINKQYSKEVLPQLNPKDFEPKDATDEFGQLLHTVQDFYAHSNWVDLIAAGAIKEGIIEDSLGLWKTFTPWSEHKGVIIVQGEERDLPKGWKLENDKQNPNVVWVIDEKGVKRPGLISGTFGLSDDCPDCVARSHGQLNKDNAQRPNFALAKKLAIQQTLHEWCRLVKLVYDRYGKKGLEKFLDAWVKPNMKGKALEICNLQNLLAAVTILDQALAKAVSPNPPYTPERTETFATTDSKAFSWVKLQGPIYGAHRVQWKWYSPDGMIYFTHTEEVPDPSTQGHKFWSYYVVWSWIGIKGYEAERKPGTWKVEVYIDGRKALTQTFLLRRPEPTPSAGVTVGEAALEDPLGDVSGPPFLEVPAFLDIVGVRSEPWVTGVRITIALAASLPNKLGLEFQTTSYKVYLDLDRNPGTGFSKTPFGEALGAELLLQFQPIIGKVTVYRYLLGRWNTAGELYPRVLGNRIEIEIPVTILGVNAFRFGVVSELTRTIGTFTYRATDSAGIGEYTRLVKPVETGPSYP